MNYLAVNWLAVLLAGVASMAFGAAYYMVLSKPWQAALDRPFAEIAARHGGSASPFAWAALVQLVFAYGIALFTPAVFGETNVVNAVVLALHVSIGFGLTAMILNHRFEAQKWALTAIDGGNLVAMAVVQGVVIGLFGQM